MKITPEDLKTERHWRSATGMDKARFYKLLEGFKKSYRDEYSQTLKDRQVDNKQGYCINNEEELLLFTLLSLKSGLTYDLLGLMCGMDGSNAQRNQRLGLGLLQQTLNTTGDLPKSNFLNTQEFEAYFANTDTLIIDATEQQISRPSDKSAQRDHYSGKKKTHTLKSMIISSSDKFIKYISPCYQGNCHDYKLLKIEFPPEKNWFEKWIVKVDLGYLGIAKEYRCKQVFIPCPLPTNIIPI